MDLTHDITRLAHLRQQRADTAATIASLTVTDAATQYERLQLRLDSTIRQIGIITAAIEVDVIDHYFMTGEHYPHPAVRVLPKIGTEPGVKIDSDLSAYLASATPAPQQAASVWKA